MKIVKLKEDFVLQAIELDNEFLEKSSRGYMYIKVNVEHIDYLIPFRSSVTHNYCYEFKQGAADSTCVDFTKSIPIVNENIIDNNIYIDRKFFELYEKNVYNIAKQFTKYLVNNHKNNKYGVNHDSIIMLQNKF